MASILIALFACTRSAIMSYKSAKNETPSEARQRDPKGDTLRQKAAKKLHGKDANPSQLGDPVSLKAETSSTIPTERQEGSSSMSSMRSTEKNQGYGSKHGHSEKLREKAAKQLHGEDANPSMLGDPISIKAETSDWIPTEGEEGAKQPRESKL